jgi:hypothetical protein
MTTMQLERTADGDLRFSGVVHGTDFARLRLDSFDRSLIADCEGEGRSAADWLLALETIFRRMREQGIAGRGLAEGWTRELPTGPGVFDHRNLENAKGRAPIPARLMFVGYVNWAEDRGHGTTPMRYGSGKLRACRIDHPMTADSLTVQEWGGEWRRANTQPPLSALPPQPASKGEA